MAHARLALDSSDIKGPDIQMSEAAYSREDPLIGRMVEERYRVDHKIAEGGMASVYEALDTRLDRTVAIKVMHMQLAQGPHRDQFVERFRREAKSAAAIANPHIVQVYDTGEIDGLDFLVMEYVHGVNLRREMNEQGTFTVRETLRIVAETLDGLASAHRAGVVHRDIKPENILINDRGHVQITDFGLAKAASQATLSSTGMLLGTAAYLAPEMIELNQATPQGDLYSVGIMAWEMLTGEVPFKSDNPVTLVFKHVHEDVPSVSISCPGIDPRVAAFIAHLTARNVAARPADAAQAAQELTQLTAQLDIAAWTYRKPTTNAHGNDDATAPLDATVPVDATSPLQVSTAQPVTNTTTHQQESRADAEALSTTALPPAPPSSAATTIMPTVAQQAATTQTLPTNPLATVADLPGDQQTEPAKPSSHGATASASRRTATPFIVGAIALLLAVAIGGGAAWWYFLGPGSYWTVPKPDDITCVEGRACEVTGASWSKYQTTLSVSNIPFTTSEQYSDTVPEGSIISSTPSNVGDRVSKRAGGSMSLVISKGVKPATVPSDILDTSSENGTNVLSALQNAGFDHIKHDDSNDQYSLTVPSGAAISITDANGTDIKPGATLSHNDEITVVLSKGPMPVTMPNIIGLTQSEAQSALADLQLKFNVTEEYDDKVAAGSVVSASQNAGAQLHWGDSVDIVVSKGPQKATIPSGLIGKQESDVTKTLKELGFDVKTDRVLGGLFGTVRSIKNGDTDVSNGGEVRLRDENGKATVLTLTIV